MHHASQTQQPTPSDTTPSGLGEPLRVVVLGAGALGSLYGGLLAKAGCQVALISTRAAHVQALRTQGLTLESQGREDCVRTLFAVETARELLEHGAANKPLPGKTYNNRTPDDPTQNNPYQDAWPPGAPVDLLLVCVKSTATAEAMSGAACLLSDATLALTLQNVWVMWKPCAAVCRASLFWPG